MVQACKKFVQGHAKSVSHFVGNVKGGPAGAVEAAGYMRSMTGNLASHLRSVCPFNTGKNRTHVRIKVGTRIRILIDDLLHSSSLSHRMSDRQSGKNLLLGYAGEDLEKGDILVCRDGMWYTAREASETRRTGHETRDTGQERSCLDVDTEKEKREN